MAQSSVTFFLQIAVLVAPFIVAIALTPWLMRIDPFGRGVISLYSLKASASGAPGQSDEDDEDAPVLHGLRPA